MRTRALIRRYSLLVPDRDDIVWLRASVRDRQWFDMEWESLVRASFNTEQRPPPVFVGDVDWAAWADIDDLDWRYINRLHLSDRHIVNGDGFYRLHAVEACLRLDYVYCGDSA